jgi:hypothetical protein
MNKKVKISDIKVKFGGDSFPEDRKLIGLLKKAYSGEQLVKMALIKFDAIKPFSEFKPHIPDEYLRYFEELEQKDTPPPLYVYPDDKCFVMSDDYNAYFAYKEKGYSEVMCVLLGDSDNKDIIEKSDPFILPQPEAEQIG